ncbi:site-2 protease family protein [Georgenia sp. AZ-5]|uniref:site-2 protease family protein n=1 Tax=Georgenia sp. AZ-5 TaxID=3367526 RepID=UPI003754A023
MSRPTPDQARAPRVGSRTTTGWVIGRVGGTPVVLAPSWLLIAAVLMLIYFPTVRAWVPRAPTGTVVLTTVAFVVMLFVSVLVHEFAHGLTARRFGVHPREYVATFWGGHTSFTQELPTAGASAVVSAAGPAANAALAGLAWLATSLLELDITAWLVLAGAVFSNLLVAGFNLLPGLPLDGGRVLEALVWAVTGDRARGTVVAAWGGRVVVVAVAAWFLLEPLTRGSRPSVTTLLWVAVLGSFVWSGAGRSLEAAALQRSARDLDLRALAAPAVTLPAAAPLAEADGAIAGGAAVVLQQDGLPVGLVDPAAAARVPWKQRPVTPLHAVARALRPEQVVSQLAGPEALDAVARAQRHGPAVVLTAAGVVVGVAEVARVAAYLRTRG